MGLTSTLNNATSGLSVNRDALDILSRNLANKGTPGYHRQSLNVVDYNSERSSYARTMGVNRAFNNSLQTYYTRQVSDTSSSSVQANYLDRLQGLLGKPGSAGSLDTVFDQLQNSLEGLATSPEDYNQRAQVMQQAKDMVGTLNMLSNSVQDMRKETEGQIATDVDSLNGMLSSLHEVNSRLLDVGADDAARASLMDQRDRLVSSVSELIDVKADYRSNGSVSLMTRSGVSLIDENVATFSFESMGNMSAGSQFDPDPSKNQVGKLFLTTSSGVKLDLVSQNVIQGGELDGLLKLRDETLVEAQSQLDQIAAGLAQAFSTNQTAGEAVAGGYSSDLAGIQPGNDLTMKVMIDGVEQTVKIVNTDQMGMDYRDAAGTRVIGVDMSQGDAAVADKLNAAFTDPAKGVLGVTVGATGGKLTFVGSGTGPGDTQVTGVTKRSTSAGVQGEGLAMSLFVDVGNSAFTNDLDGNPPQMTGFAGRIAINSDVLDDNTLLVESVVGQTMGDAARPNFIIDQLKSLQFVNGGDPATSKGRFQLNGNLGDVIGQVITFQGTNTQSTITQSSDRQLTLNTIIQQMDSEYGVDVDDEMARLMELQNSYAANAQVVGVVKELLDALFNAV